MAPTIGVDVGGTKLLAVALDADDAVVASHRVPTPRGSGGDAGTALLDGIAESVAALGLDDATGVGVGMAGLVDLDGVLRHGPNQPGVGRLDVAGGLRTRLGGRVVVDNDANCAVLAEVRTGAARGMAHVVLVTLGTGIGGGLVVDGRLVRGRHGLAGEPGHMVVDPGGPACVCGGQGCWERYASGAGLALMARTAAAEGRLSTVVATCGGDVEAIDGETVVAAARSGDPEARAVLDELAWWVALGLANLAAVLDPERFVLGGGLIDAADCWIDQVRHHLPHLLVAGAHRAVPGVVEATHGSAAAAVGAALLARGPG